eukprot:23996-Pyramimonas_sp.AAC.1
MMSSTQLFHVPSRTQRTCFLFLFVNALLGIHDVHVHGGTVFQATILQTWTSNSPTIAGPRMPLEYKPSPLGLACNWAL